MGAKILSTNYPAIVIRKFDDFSQAYISMINLARGISELKRQTLSAINDHGTRLTPTQGAGVPASTPTDVGLYYLDTSAKDMYISVGTASSADWKKVTP